MKNARRNLAIALAITPLLWSGCRKKSPQKQSAKPTGETPPKSANAPGQGRPGPRRAAVAKQKGASAPPPAVVKALGEPPKMMIRANLSTWGTSPLTRPLMRLATAGLQKGLGRCAKHLELKKLKRAFFVQSTGRFIRRAEDSKRDAHLIVFETGNDVPALLTCLEKTGLFKASSLNGGTAYAPTKKTRMRQSWWFASGKQSLTIVDGPWAKRVTPGEGPLGTAKLLSHVGPQALRLWATDFAPDIPAVVAFVTLGPTVVGRADVTWRDRKDARAMPALIRSFSKIKPEIAKALAPLRVAVHGKVTTFTYRASQKEARSLTQISQMLFTAGGDSSHKGPARTGREEGGTKPTQKPRERPAVAEPPRPAQRPAVVAPRVATPMK